MLKDRTLKTTLISTPIRTEGTRYSEEAQRFHAWLVAHVTRKPDIQTEQAYKQESAVQLYRGKHIQQFAPFRAAQSAYQTWTPGQVALLSVLAAITLVSIILTGISTLTTIFSVVTLFYVALLGLTVAWLLGVSRLAPATPFSLQTIDELKHAPWPSYTILCPLYKEKAVVPQFVEAIRALDYPTDCLQVLFLTEADDEETRQAILALRLPSHFQILVVPPGSPKTKPRACNYGLLYTTGEYVVIFDAEDIPDPLQLKKAVLTFASSDPTVACVQAKLNFYNPAQNLLTRWFTIEYTLWFGLILPGLQRLGFSLPLGGTSNHFRASTLRHVGAWDAFNVTEDCDLGLKLAQYGLQTVMLDSLTMEEANSRPLSWIKQRSRWIKGYMQTYLVHTRHPFKMLKQGKMKDILSLHLFVGAGSIILLVNPIMWAMFAVYLIWHPVALYHQLFPWPVLYAGMLCFLVGNFLPIYASMIACVRQEQYALVKWCLLLPLYWILASTAAVLAAYELIRKPHHWHKTQHGLHLQGHATAKVLAVAGNAAPIANVQGPIAVAQAVTASMRAMPTVLTPAVSTVKGKKTRARDPWLLLTLATACVCSIVATMYFFQQHDILLYSDASAHMRIARSVFDSLTPGLAQLGTVWLPLPHILMWPFVWNNTLWHDGLAGSFVSMPCYVATGLFLFLSLRRLACSSSMSYLGSLVFLLNPNILYLQSTPLSELVCIATITIAGYFFLKWCQNGKLSSMISAAAWVFLATLARYDGWPLFAACVFFIFVVLLLKTRNLRQIEAMIILFSLLGGIGIVLWVLWNFIIFGDPLYFQRGPYSSLAQQTLQLQQHQLYSYHNLFEAFRYYLLDTQQTLGIAIFLLGCVGLVVCVISLRRSWKVFGVLAFFAPFAFYILALYDGNAILWLPQAVPAGVKAYMYNTRYGAEMVVPAALVIGFLAQSMRKIPALFAKLAGRWVCAGIVIAQCILVWNTGIITLQDGQYNYSCEPKATIVTYLEQHYDQGNVLQDVYASGFDVTPAGINFSNVVYEGSGPYWLHALHTPTTSVDWIIVRPYRSAYLPDDLIAKYINVQSPEFLSHWTLLNEQSNGVQLYHRIGLPPLPSRSLPSQPVYPHHPCLNGGGN